MSNDPDTPPSADPPFRVVTTSHGVRLLLPPRQLGKLRWIGLISPGLLVVALAFIIAISDFLWEGLQPFLHTNTSLLHWAFIALVVLACAAAMVKTLPGFHLFLLGFGILFSSRCEIYLDDQTIRNIEHAGPFACTMVRRRRDSIKELRVAGAGIDSSSNAPTAATRFYSLQLLPSPDSKKKDFAPAYPRAILIALARELQQRLALGSAEDILRSRTTAAPPEVEILPVQEFASPDLASAQPAEPALAQPPHSRIQLLQQNGLTTCVIPPTGFTGGTRALLIFGAVWTAFSLAFTGGTFYVIFLHEHEHLFVLPFITIGSLFVGAGIVMLLSAWQIARRHSVFIATPDALTFTQTGPLRKFERQFPRSSIAAIRADNSGTSINDRPLLQLQLRLTDGSTTGLLTGRDETELRWLACTLRQTLRLPATPQPVQGENRERI